MSLILGYADKEHGIIMSDGKAGGSYRPSETYNKTKRFNQNIIIGFCGEANYIEEFLKETYRSIGEEIEEYKIDDLYNLWKFQVENNTLPDAPVFSILGIGKDNNNNICLFIFGKGHEFEFSFRIIEEETVSIMGGKNEILYKKIYLKNMFNTNNEVFENMKNTILTVSKIDETINDTIFFQEI